MKEDIMQWLNQNWRWPLLAVVLVPMHAGHKS